MLKSGANLSRIRANFVTSGLGMIKKWVLGILKFFVVDSTVNILGDLFEQPPIMWIFIGWGWVSILAMLLSVYQTLGQM